MTHQTESGAGWTMHLGNALEILPTIGGVNHAIFDPPYSRHVHASVRSSKRADLPDTAEFSCRTKRVVDLGFEHLRPHVRRAVARWCAGNVSRWVAAFSDVESDWLWRLSLSAAGLRYVKTAEWIRIGGAPQFTGTEPAQSNESITLCHRFGRRRWNGGGKAGRYEHPIVANRLGQRGSRVHETQKPLGLMLDLVRDFTDEGETIADPFAGSGTTLVAAIRLGRKAIGIEQREDHFLTACERLRAEERGLSLPAARSGQASIFDLVGAKP